MKKDDKKLRNQIIVSVAITVIGYAVVPHTYVFGFLLGIFATTLGFWVRDDLV